mmetsp:Transcript_10246/g.28995  ORF Transcript_10246/g.28995 Transcript_10246/m.28995 type:complete len:278 (-) Transcript_10246:272-1105(-)
MHARAVHPLQEIVRGALTFRDDALRVATSVAVDEVDGLLLRLHNFHGYFQITVLVLWLWCRRQTQFLCCLWPPVHLDPLASQSRQRFCDHRRVAPLGAPPVEQHRLRSVAGGRVVHLAVHHDLQNLAQVRLLVHVNVADTVGVPEHGYFRVALNVRHELVRAPWDHQVDQVVHAQEVLDLVPRGHEAHEGAGQASPLDGVRDDRVDDFVRVGGLLSTLEEEPVPAPDREGRNLREGVRPRLENDQENPERRGHLLQLQALCDLRPPQHPADRVAALR